MLIYIVNTSETIIKADFDKVIKAIRKQVSQHFSPVWGMNATIKTKMLTNKGKQDPSLNKADVILYVGELSDDPDSVDNALGYHSLNYSGIPFGFVFTDIAAQTGEHWSVTLSHEVLELVADPDVNLLVTAPHPKNPKQWCLLSYEVCDPVQGDVYQIDGVDVSNFVLPLYFAELPSTTKVDTNYMKLPLERQKVRPGGYLAYFDFQAGKWNNVFGEHAEERAQKKAKMGLTRRNARKFAQTSNS